MAIFPPKLDGVDLPHLSDYREKEGMRGGAILLVNGGIKFDTVSTKKRTFSLIWKGLTSQQKKDVSDAFMAINNTIGTDFRPPYDNSVAAPSTIKVTWSNEGFELEWAPTSVNGGTRLLWEATMLLREV